MKQRQIVSKQYEHCGGIARIEKDNGDHLYMHCSGCKVEHYYAGMANALEALVKHVGLY